MAMAMGKIYTFGPTFRAEKSKTRRHLSEFWMIEPEMAFFDNDMNMDLIEKFIKYVISDVLENNKFELDLLERNTEVLEASVKKQFPRISYDEAVELLTGKKSLNGKNAIHIFENLYKENKDKISNTQDEIKQKEDSLKNDTMKKGKRNFLQNKVDSLKNELTELEKYNNNIPTWIDSAKNFKYGNDFGGSDETVLTRLFETPIMVYNWPHEIKAFYMKRDETGKKAKGVDVLAPEGFGEIVGGAQREDNLELLLSKIKEHNLPQDVFDWYLDLRRFGSVPHAGFGLGLERFVAWLCNAKHIRETIPFPRLYGYLEP